MKHITRLAPPLFFAFFLFSCKSAIKEKEDEIYSRHLQRHVKLTILTTPLPSNKEEMNLLVFNGANEMEQLGMKKILDSLYQKQLIQPLVIVGVDGLDKEYGITGLNTANGAGAKAEKYSEFFSNELYPFIKKRVVIRKFKSVAIAGCKLAGISALDITWNNADKISKVGIFSGDFDYAGKTDTTNNILSAITASRKRPRLGFWLFAGTAAGDNTLKQTFALKHILEAKKTIATDNIVLVTANGANDITAWRNNFAAFLLWAFGK